MAFQHKKKYGQNFLTKQAEILARILEVSEVQKQDNILEIGPGEGALTELLLQEAKSVVNIEIDEDLKPILEKKFGKNENYRLIMGDVLEVDFSKYMEEGTKVVANIPYYITSPIIQKIIEHRSLIPAAFLMAQKEVGERICAKRGRERSALTLSVEYFARAEYLFTIPKEYFTPVPKVDSAFIGIHMKEREEIAKQIPEELFFKYVKAGFWNKRKNLVNNFSSLGFSKTEIKESLIKLGIAENERAENLSLQEWFSVIETLERSSIGE